MSMDILMGILAFLSVVLWIWAFIDIRNVKVESPFVRIFAYTLILVLPMVGPLLYFQLKRKYIC